MIRRHLYSLLIFGCLSLFQTVNSQQGQVIINQDPQIDKLLEYKKDIRTNSIFKIQVFQSTRPNQAEEVKSEFLEKYSKWPVTIIFNTPNYKVWVGNFKNQLEADRALAEIKKEYLYAFIFEPKTDFKKDP